MSEPSNPSSPSLGDLPTDELAAYADELGLAVDLQTPRGELLRLIRERHELLLQLDRDAMLDVVVWARLPVRKSASKESLARLIAGITRTRFDGLSHRGLGALARLRGVDPRGDEPRGHLERRLRRAAGVWSRFQQKRRSIVGTLITSFLEGTRSDDEYQFLPEKGDSPSLKEQIEDVGVVGGIAQKLRGAADQYVHEKLDEIERRIDRKLDEIDRRLEEWRDREISNRLRIIKFTLVTAIIVAALSLGYDYLRAGAHTAGPDLESSVKAESP